jgi:HK97 family phage prohead protease
MYQITQKIAGVGVAIADTELKFSETVGEFTGYGSVFNVKDSYGDVIMPGAFDDVIKSGDPVKVYVNHDWRSYALPVGEWNDLKQDQSGLMGRANLETRMPKALDAYWAVKGGLISGLSIGFKTDKSGFEIRKDGGRNIYNIKMLKEISLVDNPSNDLARITSIKTDDFSFEEELEAVKTERDLEYFLRESGIYTKSRAMAVIAKIKAIRVGGDHQPDIDATPIIQRLNQLAK